MFVSIDYDGIGDGFGDGPGDVYVFDIKQVTVPTKDGDIVGVLAIRVSLRTTFALKQMIYFKANGNKMEVSSY